MSDARVRAWLVRTGRRVLPRDRLSAFSFRKIQHCPGSVDEETFPSPDDLGIELQPSLEPGPGRAQQPVAADLVGVMILEGMRCVVHESGPERSGRKDTFPGGTG